MQSILEIIELAGGYRSGLYLKIENAPYMSLVIEAVGFGPAGSPALSVAHYGEQNGDLMRDPEMCFELETADLNPYYWRNDYVGIEQWSRNDDGVILANLHRQHKSFAQMWDKNISAQGFVKAFSSASILG